MKKIYLSLSILLVISSTIFAYEDGIRIAWDYTTAKFITTGVYARVKRISTGELALVYSDGPSVWIKKSTNNGNTWSNAVLVSQQSGYNYTNSELVQLSNGWLLYAWNCRPQTDGSIPYLIKIKISKDNGATWVNEQIVYTADVVGANGCWEPAMLQIASGEIQLFFANENPYRNSGEQEISLTRSFDNGLTWSTIITTSFRAGYRDGMPVPIALQNNKGLVYCIEDNGLSGTFKPTIIWSSNADNWNQGVATATSSRRWGALRSDYMLASSIYAGAPYITQLPTGETILSCQSTEGRTGQTTATANMRVYIGDENAKNFSRPSTPFPWLAATGNALWSSLNIIDSNTIMAVSSVNTAGSGKNGIWIIKGKVIRPIQVKSETVQVDGIISPNEWSVNSDIFIGSQSNTNLNAQLKFDENNLYVLCDVKDKYLWADSPDTAVTEDDGLEISIDPQNMNCRGICNGLYKLKFNIENKVLYEKTNTSNVWTTWTPMGINFQTKINGTLNNNSDIDQGFTMEIAIPWSQIGGKPEANTGWGIHFKLHDDTNGGNAEVHEDLSGNNASKAYTWLKVSLDQITSILNMNENDHFKVYPNPANAQLIVDSGQSTVNEIKIINLQGEIVCHENKTFNSLKTIDIKGLSRGIYFLTLLGDHVNSTKKIIVK